MKKQIHAISLSPENLRLLLDTQGIEWGEAPHLASLLSVTPGEDASRLDEQSLLEKDPAWRAALNTLCNPAYEINTATFLAQSVVAANFYANGDADNMVSCHSDSDNVHISFPWNPETIAEQETNSFGVGAAESNTNGPRYEFSPDALFLLAAAIDAIREVLLASTLQRAVLSDFQLPLSELDTMLRKSLDDKSGDARWLVTLLRMTAPAEFGPDRTSLVHPAIIELERQALVSRPDATNWTPLPDLIGLAHDLLFPVPALMVRAQGSGTRTSTLTFNGKFGLSTIKFAGADNSPTAHLTPQSHDSFRLEVMGAMIPPKQKIKPAPAPEPGRPRFCTGCGSRLQSDVRFCTQCGKKI